MITYAITNAIYSLFGDSISLYTDSTVQGMSAPCFFVHEIGLIGKDYISSRKGVTHLYEMVYVTDTDRMDGLNEELTKVSNSIMTGFEFMSYEGENYRAFNKKCTKVDNELHFTFSVFETYRNKEDVTLMEKLELKWK